MDLIEQLIKTKEETLSYFDLTSIELAKRYTPGKWTVHQMLHHLADAESVLYDRIRRVISEPRHVIWNFDQDAWCANLRYEDVPLSINKAVYHSVRNAVIHYAEEFYESHGDQEFIHSETGRRTLKEEFEKIATHNAHHLGQIKKALEG